MDIHQLRYFLTLCESKSLSNAAEKLNISAQGLSASMRRLENELNCKLFLREIRGIALTDAGEKVRAEVEVILSHVTKIEDICKLSGKVSIPIAMTRGRLSLLPGTMQNILIDPPEEFEIRITNDYSISCIDMVKNNSATFGFVYGDPNPEIFDVTLLEKVQYSFVVNKANKLYTGPVIPLQDLNKITLAIPGEKSTFGKHVAKVFSSHNLTYNVIESVTPRSAIDLAMNNTVVVARTPTSLLTPADMEKLSVVSIPDLGSEASFYLIHRKDRKLTVHEKLFKHMVIDCFRE